MDDIFCLETTVHRFFEFAVVNESAYNLKNELKLVLVPFLRRLPLLFGCPRFGNLLSAALQEAGKNLVAPLFRTVSI